MTSPLSSIATRSVEPRTVEIAVPGSTSNLGAGFDALGLALSVYLRLKVTIGGDEPHVTFRFGGLTLDGENSIERALRAAAARYGTTLPPLTVDVTSDIPLKAGLGSSAAAIVAGIRLYEAIAGALPIDEVLTLASDLEGHPDNTSASILGGLVTSCQADGQVLAVATPWPTAIRVVVATPLVGLETKVARAALPDSISRGDAIFNVQRTALFVQAIAAGRYDVRARGAARSAASTVSRAARAWTRARVDVRTSEAARRVSQRRWTVDRRADRRGRPGDRHALSRALSGAGSGVHGARAGCASTMTMMTGLECHLCHTRFPAEALFVCDQCFGPLEPVYDYDAVKKVLTRELIASRPRNLWRYRELLPITGEPRTGFTSGFTPLVQGRSSRREAGREGAVHQG